MWPFTGGLGAPLGWLWWGRGHRSPSSSFCGAHHPLMVSQWAWEGMWGI